MLNCLHKRLRFILMDSRCPVTGPLCMPYHIFQISAIKTMTMDSHRVFDATIGVLPFGEALPDSQKKLQNMYHLHAPC